MRMKDMLGTLGNMSYRKPTQPGLNKTEKNLLILVTKCLQVNSVAGSGCSGNGTGSQYGAGPATDGTGTAFDVVRRTVC